MKREIVAIVMLAGLAVNGWGAEFYVSPAGDDAAAGSRKAPFASLGRAREAVRELRAQNPAEDITVWFDEGAYTFSETEVFGLNDSGSETQSISYRALPEKEVVFSAGAPVTNTSRS